MSSQPVIEIVPHISDTIREWLDEMQPGWSAKYSAVFEDVGADDLVDLFDLSDEGIGRIIMEIEATGITRVDLRKLRDSLDGVRNPGLALNKKLNAALSHEAELTELTSRDPVLKKAIEKQKNSQRQFAAFLSHHKAGAAMEARYVHNELERILGASVFLDSDDLRDLRQLMEHVRASDVLVVMQSARIFERP